jgi:hypothetical protein
VLRLTGRAAEVEDAMTEKLSAVKSAWFMATSCLARGFPPLRDHAYAIAHCAMPPTAESPCTDRTGVIPALRHRPSCG